MEWSRKKIFWIALNCSSSLVPRLLSFANNYATFSWSSSSRLIMSCWLIQFKYLFYVSYFVVASFSSFCHVSEWTEKCQQITEQFSFINKIPELLRMLVLAVFLDSLIPQLSCVSISTWKINKLILMWSGKGAESGIRKKNVRMGKAKIVSCDVTPIIN